MGEAAGQIVALAIGVTLTPLAVIAVVLMLTTPGGRRNAVVFVLGWMAGLALVAAAAVLLADAADANDGGDPAAWAQALKAGAGLLLLWVAVQQWRGRPRGDAEPELPGWMQQIDTFTTAKSASTALAFAAVKPKNLILTVSAAVTVAQAGVGAGAQAGALAVFVALATLGPGAPLVTALVLGERAAVVLADVRTWLVRENAVIIAVVCVILAAKLLGDVLAS